ncbi:MAG: type II toxin-antitoxin system VapC family toxin [Deltaproteobacteria bacterium]|nr:type II toxin-antitoxin system VapC family toxin [Deltaproteobacteria bacterium]
MSVLLDTHMWVWWLTAPSPLTVAERAALDLAAERHDLSIAAISMWEVQILHAKGRLELPLPFAEWLCRATDESVIRTLPLDRDVVIAVDGLPESFHGDPADRIIVATARAHAISLATRDAAIRRARVVRLWRP